jgi:hypothetical protein
VCILLGCSIAVLCSGYWQMGRLQQVPKTLVDSGRNENSAFYLFLDLLETQRNPSLSISTCRRLPLVVAGAMARSRLNPLPLLTSPLAERAAGFRERHSQAGKPVIPLWAGPHGTPAGTATPSATISLSSWMSIFWLTPATSRRSSPNRLGPLARFHRMRNFHLPRSGKEVRRGGSLRFRNRPPAGGTRQGEDDHRQER